MKLICFQEKQSGAQAMLADRPSSTTTILTLTMEKSKNLKSKANILSALKPVLQKLQSALFC